MEQTHVPVWYLLLTCALYLCQNIAYLQHGNSIYHCKLASPGEHDEYMSIIYSKSPLVMSYFFIDVRVSPTLHNHLFKLKTYKLYLKKNAKKQRVNNVDPDEVAHFEPPHLNLCCL